MLLAISSTTLLPISASTYAVNVTVSPYAYVFLSVLQFINFNVVVAALS